MRKDIVLPGLAVLGGALGFGLRKWQWASGYDPGTQLFLHGHPASYALAALFLLLAAAFLLLARNARGPETAAAAFRCPAPWYMTLMAAAAILFLGAGVLGLLEGMEQLTLCRLDPESHVMTYPIALLLCALLSFAAGPSTLLVGKSLYRGNQAPNDSLWAVFPAIAALAWLFTTHLAHSTDPVLTRYGFSLAAAVLLLLSHYNAAAFHHGRPHPRQTTFCALLGVSLGLVSLADSLSPFQLALTAAFILSALASVSALLHNVFGPPWPQHLLDAREEDGEDERP